MPYPKDGRRVCFGALADGLHQVIAALRTARFTVVGAPHLHPKPFTRVAVAGYSLGGTIAEVEQASFVDQSALALIGWADQGFSRFGSPPSYVFAHCSPGLPKSPGGRTAYFRTLPAWKLPHLVSPASILGSWRRFARTRTGPLWSKRERRGVVRGPRPKGIASDTEPGARSLRRVRDALFTPQAWQPQWAHFTGTHDRTLIGIPDGQMLMLDRHVPMTRRLLSTWLAAHGSDTA